MIISVLFMAMINFSAVVGAKSPFQMGRAMRLFGSSSNIKVIGTEVAYKGWRSIVSKEALYPDGRTRKFDIVTQGEPSVLVFPWDTATKTTTLLREYQPGTEEVKMNRTPLFALCAHFNHITDTSFIRNTQTTK